MINKNSLCSKVAGMALIVAALVTLPTTSVSAEGFLFDWGGEKVVEGSGRAAVKLAAAKKVGDIIVSFGDRKLYLVTAVGEALSYPIAVPKEKARWEGKISVTSKRENPSWTPTPSMRVENPKLPMWVPGGHPMNPLGQRALYLGSSTYRIHGTDAPWTIGSAASAGCVRMYNKDVADLYPRVNVGASVLVTWDKYDSTVNDKITVPAVAAPHAGVQRRRSPTSRPIVTGSIEPTAAAAAPKRVQVKRPERSAAAAQPDNAPAAKAPAPPAKSAVKPKYAIEEMSL
jgi:lipoprotein-anchoring transpeptidase ErfK/SrfK